MAKKNFYAVKRGRTPGIYRTWAECRENTEGFSGAVYKGFAAQKDAEEYMNLNPGDSAGEGGTAADPSSGCDEADVIAYVDGSYNSDTGEYSYGAVFLMEDEELTFSRKFSDKEMAEMRNVAGEIEGARFAITFCLDRGIGSLEIYHDYEGIARWCTGEWQARKPGTIAYRDFYRAAAEKMKIRFVHVKGHSGDEYNELADKLAKQALRGEETE